MNDEGSSCLRIFEELQKLLNAKAYKLVNSYLEVLMNGTISEMKSALIITKGVENFEDIKDAREKLRKAYEEKKAAMPKNKRVEGR